MSDLRNKGLFAGNLRPIQFNMYNDNNTNRKKTQVRIRIIGKNLASRQDVIRNECKAGNGWALSGDNDESNIRPNELANISRVTPSTVYSMLDERTSKMHTGSVWGKALATAGGRNLISRNLNR